MLLSILLGLTFVLSSCGTIQTQTDRERRWRRCTNLQLRAMVDDADFLMLMDRNPWMTEYHVDSKY